MIRVQLKLKTAENDFRLLACLQAVR